MLWYYLSPRKYHHIDFSQSSQSLESSPGKHYQRSAHVFLRFWLWKQDEFESRQHTFLFPADYNFTPHGFVRFSGKNLKLLRTAKVFFAGISINSKLGWTWSLFKITFQALLCLSSCLIRNLAYSNFCTGFCCLDKVWGSLHNCLETSAVACWQETLLCQVLRLLFLHWVHEVQSHSYGAGVCCNQWKIQQPSFGFPSSNAESWHSLCALSCRITGSFGVYLHSSRSHSRDFRDLSISFAQ